MQNYQFKVVLLGEGCVGKFLAPRLHSSIGLYFGKIRLFLKFIFLKGKTSLMLRFVHDQFNDKHLSTTQAAFLRKKIKLGNKTVELAIWVEWIIV